MRAPGEKGRSMHYPKRRVTSGDETGLFGQLATRARHRILAFVEGPGGHLPRRLVPGVAPLAHEHRVGVVEVGDDERGVGGGGDRIRGLRAVGKLDHVGAKHEWPGATRDPGSHHVEGPAARGMREVAQVLWVIAATAAAGAATWRGCGQWVQ